MTLLLQSPSQLSRILLNQVSSVTMTIDNNQLGFYKHVSSHKDLQDASAKAERFIKIPTGKMPLS